MASVLWFQGRACSGNTMSFLNAEEPNVVDLIVDFGLDLIWHPSLGLELGKNAQKVFWDCAKGERPLDIFVFEGTVIEAPRRHRPDGHVRRPPDEGLGDRPGRPGPDRGRDRRLCLLGRHSGHGAEPVGLHRPAVPQAREGRVPRTRLPLQDGPAGHQHPGCPAHPDWITQIIVALATGRAGDIALDELHRPETFFKTFTQTGCTCVQFFEYKQSTMSFGEGHPHRLPVLRVRLPGSDDPLAVQPHPVEPAVLEDPGRHAVPGLHRAGVPCTSTWRRARCSRPRRSAG